MVGLSLDLIAKEQFLSIFTNRHWSFVLWLSSDVVVYRIFIQFEELWDRTATEFKDQKSIHCMLIYVARLEYDWHVFLINPESKMNCTVL